MSVKIRGAAKVKAALADVAAAVEAGAEKGRRETAELIAGDWRANVPVDTGAYKRSIQADDDGAFATAAHAPAVEFGSSTTPARPAGAAAAELGRKNMPEIVADAIRRELP